MTPKVHIMEGWMPNMALSTQNNVQGILLKATQL